MSRREPVNEQIRPYPLLQMLAWNVIGVDLTTTLPTQVGCKAIVCCRAQLPSCVAVSLRVHRERCRVRFFATPISVPCVSVRTAAVSPYASTSLHRPSPSVGTSEGLLLVCSRSVSVMEERGLRCGPSLTPARTREASGVPYWKIGNWK